MSKPLAKLSPTLRTILVSIARGDTIASIQAKLDLSPVTYRVHLSALKKALGREANQQSAISYFRALETANGHTLPLAKRNPLIQPSARQIEVARLVCNQFSHGAIASQLRISVQTVANQIGELCRRWQIAERGNARIAAMGRRLSALGIVTMADPEFS